jgi:uncharacterized protein YuzE
MLGMTYDQNVDALYIRLTDSPVARTDQIDPGTLVDLDDSGSLVGVEVLRPSRIWPLREVLTRFEIAAEDRALLEAFFGRAGMTHLVPFAPADQDIVAAQVDTELLSA